MMEGSTTFPIKPHIFTPQYDSSNGQVATGASPGKGAALEQPVAFPHYTHATTLQMSCEYCHSDARKSIHGGVPALNVCMNCHKMVKKTLDQTEPSPEIAKVVEAYEANRPLEWKKVHDAPDFVHFAHSRHVNAGLQCQECHGEIQNQGQKVDGQPVIPMVRDEKTTLQMGWCLDCHATHKAVDENYGEEANIRRAELKDCWTCHK